MTISQSRFKLFRGAAVDFRGSRGVVSTVSISGAFLLALAALFFAGSLLDEFVGETELLWLLFVLLLFFGVRSVSLVLFHCLFHSCADTTAHA